MHFLAVELLSCLGFDVDRRVGSEVGGQVGVVAEGGKQVIEHVCDLLMAQLAAPGGHVAVVFLALDLERPGQAVQQHMSQIRAASYAAVGHVNLGRVSLLRRKGTGNALAAGLMTAAHRVRSRRSRQPKRS